ncbi:MAG: complex I NDUFA9 subunit family protein, partial [Halobacteriaceae archaeon]
TAYIRAKGRAEETVREMDGDWTILRPSVVFGEGGEFISFTSLLTPPILAPLPGGGKTRFQPIWVGDLVKMIGHVADDPTAHAGNTYEIGGPETLTLAEIARTIRHSRGHPVKILPIPMTLARMGLAIGELIPGFPMGSDQYESLKFDNTVDDNDAEKLGVATNEMTRLSEYLKGEKTS